MAPPAVAAAWERGDIDATFIWDPVLSKVKQNGKVLISAGELAAKGKPTSTASSSTGSGRMPTAISW